MGYHNIDLSSDEAAALHGDIQDIFASAKEMSYRLLAAHIGKPTNGHNTEGTINTALVLAEGEMELAPTESDILNRHRIVEAYGNLMEDAREALETLIEKWRREEWKDRQNQRRQLKDLHRVMANLTKKIVAFERHQKQLKRH